MFTRSARSIVFAILIFLVQSIARINKGELVYCDAVGVAAEDAFNENRSIEGEDDFLDEDERIEFERLQSDIFMKIEYEIMVRGASSGNEKKVMKDIEVTIC